jgi:hypothetical protein
MLFFFSIVFSDRIKVCDYSDFHHPYEYGVNLLKNIPEGSWVIPWNDNSISILLYLKFCSKQRPDIFIVLPSPRCEKTIRKLSMDAKEAHHGKVFVEMVRSNPDRYLASWINQDNLTTGAQPSVIFVGLPKISGFSPPIRPHGMVFRFGDRRQNDSDGQNGQSVFWQNLLASPYFSLDGKLKPDVRENMKELLMRHAWWHFSVEEFELARYLTQESIRHSTRPDADVLSSMALCMLKLNKNQAARLYCEKALDVDPFNRRALHILKILPKDM